MKVAYFGLPLGAHLLLRDGHELDPCVLSPLDAPGRWRLLAALPSERVFDARALTADALTGLVEHALTRKRPELIVSWFWTRLLPERWLLAARHGAIGVHPSLLPRHRGPNPYFWTIDSGDSLAGVTLHALAREYDAGAILLRRSIPVENRNSWQLARALDRPSLVLLREGVRLFADGRPPPPLAQSDSAATWAPEPTGRELAVDWSWSTERVLRRIRALSPVPGLAVEVRGLRFFITHATEAAEVIRALEPGEAGVDGETLIIRTANGAIAIERAFLASDSALGGSPDEGLTRKALARAVAAAQAAGGASGQGLLP